MGPGDAFGLGSSLFVCMGISCSTVRSWREIAEPKPTTVSPLPAALDRNKAYEQIDSLPGARLV